MADRHQAPYIPFRCSQETSALISQIAKEQHRPKSEVLRDLVDRGLVSIGAKADEDYLAGLVRQAVDEALQPQVERLAAISAKATHISGAAFFMSIFTATQGRTPAEQRQIEEAAGTARELGIQYLKLKDRDKDLDNAGSYKRRKNYRVEKSKDFFTREGRSGERGACRSGGVRRGDFLREPAQQPGALWLAALPSIFQKPHRQNIKAYEYVQYALFHKRI